MYNRIFKDNNNREWERIDKRKARNLYNKGISLVLCADNLQPFGFWNCGIETNINNLDEYDREKSDCFDRLCNEFKFYNCISRETGYNIAFYQKREETSNV